jgi:hypothetical protein
MPRRLLRLFASLLLIFACLTPAVRSQPPAPAGEQEKSERPTFALPYAFLLIYTLVVLTIVCMPSRKA